MPTTVITSRVASVGLYTLNGVEVLINDKIQVEAYCVNKADMQAFDTARQCHVVGDRHALYFSTKTTATDWLTLFHKDDLTSQEETELAGINAMKLDEFAAKFTC